MNARYASVVLAAAAALAACACPEPMIPTPPEVEVTQLDSTLITPELIKFKARVGIDNRMCGDLTIDQVVYGADLHDAPLFTETFTEVRPMGRYGHLTVTFPFQIAMQDVMKQGLDVLAEEGIRVCFRGEVYPTGFEPLPFRATRTIPLPRIPLVSFAGAEGSPFEGCFTVFLGLKNTNRFPIAIESIASHLELNGKRYELLRTPGITEIAPGGSGRIPLTMEHAQGKTLSAIINVIQAGTVRLGIGGSLSCRTPYGLIYIPLALSSEAPCAASRS
jgi:hypothetical protein